MLLTGVPVVLNAAHEIDTGLELLRNPEMVKARFAIEEEELNALREFGRRYQQDIIPFIDDFYQWMGTLPEFIFFFTSPALVEKVKKQQILYWKEFFQGKITSTYLDNRFHIGAVHAQIGLPIHSYCAAMNFSFIWWKRKIEELRASVENSNSADNHMAITAAYAFHKLVQLDITIVTQTYHHNTQLKLQEALAQAQKIVDNITKVTAAVASGNYTTRLDDDGTDINQSINQMIKSLDKAAEETKRDNWLKTGQSQLAEQLRGNFSIVELSNKIITFLAHYLNAKVGVFYSVTDNNTLKLLASYAYTHRKELSNEFKVGEGLLGQTVLERKIMAVDNLPEDYLLIGSGLGSSKTASVLIAPIILNDVVKAVIELGTFETFTELQIEFLNLISESIAITLETANKNTMMISLLKETQEKSQELEVQQQKLEVINQDLADNTAKLQASEEELKTQSEQLQITNEELEEKTSYLEEQKRIMERKNNELEESKKMLENKAAELEMSGKYKSEFLSNMSHELRTPLNSLLILAQTLAMNDDGNLTEEQTKAADIIYNSGKDLLNLINEILDLSKVESGKLVLELQELNIRQLVETCHEKMEPIAHNKKIEFHLDISEETPPIIVSDTLRLEQILKNLISNAVKFTPSNGKVSFRVYKPDAQELYRIGLAEKKNMLAFSVHDTGIGIAEKDKEAIFEAFKQGDGGINRRYGGTGLGLTISQRLAHRLGGKITLESHVGKGSTFTLYSPSHGIVEKGLASNPSPVKEKITFSRKENPKILLIEDDINFLKILRSALELQGFKSLIAKTGEAGLKIAKEKKPDAIILDMGLPDVGGLQILEKLSEDKATKNIPVHVISGSDVKKDSLEKGAVGFIQKPLDKEKLDELIMQASYLINLPVQSILVIEDDKTQRDAICNILKSDNVEISTAETGKKAESLLKTKRFHCIVLDLTLPDIQGHDLLERLSKNKNIILPPVIIYTGKEISKEEQEALSIYAPTIVLKNADAPKRLLDEVSLFLHKVKKTPIYKSITTDNNSFDSNKILLVDDDMRNNIALGATLRKQGFKVATADNGKLALEILESENDIELILMDIMMPLMDGYTAIEKIRKLDKYKDIPIIALTAKAMSGDKRKCLEIGASDYLAKPIELDKLFSLMKVWLQK